MERAEGGSEMKFPETDIEFAMQAEIDALRADRDNWKKATEVAIAAEKANRAKLEAERDEMKQMAFDVSRLNDKRKEEMEQVEKWADQWMNTTKKKNAECDAFRTENAKLVERVSELALQLIYDDHGLAPELVEIARAALSRISEEA
jgi:hypothetical protein